MYFTHSVFVSQRENFVTISQTAGSGCKIEVFEMRKVLHMALLGKNHCDICLHIVICGIM